MVSYLSTSPTLSDTEEHPLFTRTIWSDDVEAQGVVHVLTHFGWTRAACLAVEDAFGFTYQTEVGGLPDPGHHEAITCTSCGRHVDVG